MKKLITILTLFITAGASASAAEIPVDIRVNGEYIITDSEPVIISGTTYAPVRCVAEALNSESISWNEKSKSASISDGDTSITISIGKKNALLNGSAVTLNGTPFIKNNRTYIPLRDFSNLFGAEVSWDDQYKNVEISKKNITVPKEIIDTSFNHTDLYWMSRIITAESCGESTDGKIAVGDVILNRKKSSLFPNTIYDVIFDRKYSVQFEPVLNGSIYNTPCANSIAAAKLSMTNPTTIGNCLYFFNPTIASSSWIEKNRVFFKTIGNHDFYL